jgi:hypothetical protein
MLSLLITLAIQSSDAQARAWAIERGFEKVGEQMESKAKDDADDFVLSLKDNPLLLSAWPSVAEGRISYEVCKAANADSSIYPFAFLDRVATRLQFSPTERAALSRDCAIYYEGLTEGQRRSDQ